MSRLEQIELESKGLPLKELARFREWFVQFDAEKWDARIEEDARTGKFDALATQALRDHENGLSSKF